MTRRVKFAVSGVTLLLALLALGAVWIGRPMSRVALDYEDCVEQARASAGSDAEYSNLMTHCGERFAGRRKAGGGYTYFDFMQNRTFDIAGPNPTDEERKQIDQSYMEFLGGQRQEMLLSAKKTEANQEQTNLDRPPQEPGAPLGLTPKIPLPVKRPAIARGRTCEDGSLSCSWAKLSTAVRGAFASVGTGR